MKRKICGTACRGLHPGAARALRLPRRRVLPLHATGSQREPEAPTASPRAQPQPPPRSQPPPDPQPHATPERKTRPPRAPPAPPAPSRVRVTHDGSIRASRAAFWGLLQSELRACGGGDGEFKAAASLLASLESVYG